MENSIKTRNSSIDIFRLVCAVMVVAIHTNPFTDSNQLIGYIMTQIIPRIAVPFFFLTSGYFYIIKLQKGEKCFKNTFINLLKLYIIWSVIYFLKDMVICLIKHESIIHLIGSYIINFFTTGTYFHFWFFPALLFSIIVSTIAYKFNLLKPLAYFSVLCYIIGLLGCSYYNIGIKIPFVSSLIQFSNFDLIRRVCLMGLPFFMLGYFIPKCVDKVNVTSIHIISSIVFFVVEIIFVNKLSLQKNIIITFGLYIMLTVIFCWLLQNPIPKYARVATITRKLANFIFYVHPLNIFILYCISDYSNIILFVLTVIVSSIEGIIFIKFNNKITNNLFM